MNNVLNFLKQEKEDILKSILDYIIQHVLDLIVIIILFGWGYVSQNWDFLGLVSKVGVILAILAYLFMAIGIGEVIYALYKGVKKYSFRNRIKTTQEKNNSIIYDGLILEEDTDRSEIDKTLRIAAELDKEFILSVNVKNSEKIVYNCFVELDNLEYMSESTYNEWVQRSFDRKSMKWDVGYKPNEGRIDINVDERKKLEIAKGFMWEGMKLSYLDGYSIDNYTLDGKYRTTLKINGKILVGRDKKEIEPIKYRIRFKRQGLYLNLLKIEKIEG